MKWRPGKATEQEQPQAVEHLEQPGLDVPPGRQYEFAVSESRALRPALLAAACNCVGVVELLLDRRAASSISARM